MRRLSLFVLSFTTVSILACGDLLSGDVDAVVDAVDDEIEAKDEAKTELAGSATVEMTEPWSGMDLPVGDGLVLISDDLSLLIAYPDGDRSALTDAYSSAVSGGAWEEQENYSNQEFTAILYAEGDQLLGLAVGTEQEIPFVYMEDVDKSQDSVVKGADDGSLALDKTSSSTIRKMRGHGTHSKGKGGVKAGKAGKKGGGKSTNSSSGNKQRDANAARRERQQDAKGKGKGSNR